MKDIITLLIFVCLDLRTEHPSTFYEIKMTMSGRASASMLCGTSFRTESKEILELRSLIFDLSRVKCQGRGSRTESRAPNCYFVVWLLDYSILLKARCKS